jgi:hypothetical protein
MINRLIQHNQAELFGAVIYGQDIGRTPLSDIVHGVLCIFRAK